MRPTRSQPSGPSSPVVVAPVATVVQEGPTPRPTFMQRLSWFGGKVLDVAESIGEGVVSILGLDDSHFQDVLDNMTEEEMAAAIEVNETRTQEYRDAGILPAETELPPDLTVEDIEFDLYSTTGPQSQAQRYRAINHGTSNADIENGGVQMQPTVSVIRNDEDFENMNPFNPNLKRDNAINNQSTVDMDAPAAITSGSNEADAVVVGTTGAAGTDNADSGTGNA